MCFSSKVLLNEEKREIQHNIEFNMLWKNLCDFIYVYIDEKIDNMLEEQGILQTFCGYKDGKIHVNPLRCVALHYWKTTSA